MGAVHEPYSICGPRGPRALQAHPFSRDIPDLRPWPCAPLLFEAQRGAQVSRQLGSSHPSPAAPPFTAQPRPIQFKLRAQGAKARNSRLGPQPQPVTLIPAHSSHLVGRLSQLESTSLQSLCAAPASFAQARIALVVLLSQLWSVSCWLPLRTNQNHTHTHTHRSP